jgi:hypothetical protein
MSFEARTLAFAERFLSDRSLRLIVAPAIADLQFEQDGGRRSAAANQLAVLRAVAGGIGEDVKSQCGTFVALAMMPAFYYAFLLVMCLDFFPIATNFWSADFWLVAMLIMVSSFGPVVACYWPDRRSRRVE